MKDYKHSENKITPKMSYIIIAIILAIVIVAGIIDKFLNLVLIIASFMLQAPVITS